MSFFSCIRPLVHSLPPETAHRVAIRALQAGAAPRAPSPHPALASRAFGLAFPSPLGLAAGFDKNAEAFAPLLDCGFGFVEIGTVTPRPQPGNPRPRLFRLSEDEAVINRLGFNGEGMEAVRRRLERRDRARGIVGVNIGMNRNTENPAADYVQLWSVLGPLADYVTINVSSPNTEGLRALQEKERLAALLAALSPAKPCPLLIKIAPDLDEAEMAGVAEAALASGVDGIIVGNTTVARPEGLKSRHSRESGGLSGRPLMPLATRQLAVMYRLTGGRIPLIGVGGITCAEDVIAKIRAGATLVQLYTALIYRGFGLAGRILDDLAALLEAQGAPSLEALRGADA